MGWSVLKCRLTMVCVADQVGDRDLLQLDVDRGSHGNVPVGH